MPNITAVPKHKFNNGDIAFRDHKPFAKIYCIIKAETLGGNTAWGYVMQYIWPDKEEAVYDDGWVSGAAFNAEQIATFDKLYQSMAEEEEYNRELAEKALSAAREYEEHAFMLGGCDE